MENVESVKGESAGRMALLLDCFQALNRGKRMVVGEREIDEKIIVSAIKYGIKIGEIVIDWDKKAAEPEVSIVEHEEKKRVQAVLPEQLLVTVERGIEKSLPGGVMPLVSDRHQYLREMAKVIKDRKGILSREITGLGEILTRMYQKYQTI